MQQHPARRPPPPPEPWEAALFGRPLTDGERARLSPGLVEALEAAGAEPRIVSAPSIVARIARVWRGYLPILALGDRIFWPQAPADCSGPGLEPHMAVLQHELQHVLEFAEGKLTPLGYVLNPRNWTYRYRLRPGRRWRDFGAEQRASIVEDYWRLAHGPEAGRGEAVVHRLLIPWAK